MPADSLGDPAEEPPPHGGVPAVAYDDQVRGVFPGGSDDLLRGMPDRKLRGDSHAAGGGKRLRFGQPAPAGPVVERVFLLDLAYRARVSGQMGLDGDDDQLRTPVTMEIYTQVSSKQTRDALKRLGDSLDPGELGPADRPDDEPESLDE